MSTESRIIGTVEKLPYTVETASDETRKITFADGYITVVIPMKGSNYTVCVSCQVGCPIGCTFCFTGKFVRNLTSDEIVEQVRISTALMGGVKPHSIVYMGMGEPMTNFVAVEDSLERIHQEFSIAYRRITVSTSGVNVDKLIGKKYNAALSLHTLDPVKRKALIPASLPIPKLLSFAQEYCRDRKYGLMIEYAMIKGENDSDEDLARLLAIDWPKNIYFNLIEYNSNGEFVKSARLQEFRMALLARGWKTFIRLSRGADIDAACGMLDVPSTN